ncbi:hypothetical protein EVAR_13479_1 [Eumeta japonica]|uniref:BESS domain-containing protein n=1 Tax=Eumeta variegata TaxID=151549 RepID=A0A4C1UYP1_EUMVA|nr:hypothetical protein EVAR_13479_1 [Eumeta japonica]
MSDDMMQFEFEPEKLIEEVKKRPGIWDYHSVEYRDMRHRRKLWTDIVTEMNPKTSKASKGELRVLELQLQKKWKGIRDCFTKYIANPKRTKRPYIYLKQLQFLLKDSELPEHESSDSEYGKKSLRWKRRRVIGLNALNDSMDLSENENDVGSDDNDNGDGDADPDDDDDDDGRSLSRLKSSNDFVFANINNSVNLQKQEAEDCDRLFLLSLLPHLKSVPEQFRLNIKMELMQVLQNANYTAKQEHKLI